MIILITAAFIISAPNPARAQYTNAIEFQKYMAEQAEKASSDEKNSSTEAKGGRYGLRSYLSESFSWNPIRGISNLFKNAQNLGGKKMVYTYPDGRTEEYVMTLWGSVRSTQGNTAGCAPIGISIIENRSCIFCPLFAVIYTAANDMSELAFNELGTAMANVMLVGFGLYVLFKALPFVGSLTKQDAPKFLVEILTQAFKVTISFVLLSNPDQIYQYFITPVLGAGLEFGSAMLFSIGDQFQSCANNIEITDDKSLLPLSLYAKLDCFIRSIQAEISIMQTVGSTLMCVGRNKGNIAGVIWDFGMVFQGLIVWGFAVLLSLAFAFYLIDATVTLGLVGALMPFLIASWPFKLTSSYTKNGIGMFLNTFFVFVFMGIVVSINVQLIGTALSGGTGTEAAAQAADSASSGGGAMAGLLEALSGNDIEKLKDMTDLGFGGFLILLCCCVFGFKFTSQATTLAEKMSGGGGISGIGNKIGGLAASGAMGVAKKASQPARKAVSKKAGELTERAGNAIGKRLGLGKHGGKTGDAKSGGAGGNKAGNNSGGGGGNSGGGGGGNSGGGSSGGGNSGGGGKKSPTKGNKFQENFNKLKKSRKKKQARKKRNHK